MVVTCGNEIKCGGRRDICKYNETLPYNILLHVLRRIENRGSIFK
jgi:hypothetical protein